MIKSLEGPNQKHKWECLGFWNRLWRVLSRPFERLALKITAEFWCRPLLLSTNVVGVLHPELEFLDPYKKNVYSSKTTTTSFVHQKTVAFTFSKWQELTEKTWTLVTVSRVSMFGILLWLLTQHYCSLRPSLKFVCGFLSLGGTCNCAGSCDSANCSCTGCKKSKFEQR